MTTIETTTTATSSNNIETEYLELNLKDDWPTFYRKIRAKSCLTAGPCSEALKPQNKNLNRYRDVHPYDHSRIVLKRGSTDYINANLCLVEKANRKYILTQGPLACTVSHFWLMVWEQESKAVLMLNKLIEKRAEKCYQYWPSKIGTVNTFTDVGLRLEYVEQHDHSYYLTRLFRLTDIDSEEQRDILQFHYITWPDFGVPCSPAKFLDFLKRVRKAGVLEANVGPPIVHCSAGIGRSGTFCLVDTCLVLIEKHGLNSVNVEEILLELRQYRTGLIQTHEQLRFSYQAIIEGAKQLLNPNLSDEEEDSESLPNHLTDELIEEASSSDDDSEPPPLPPPRTDSLKPNGVGDRPLPLIPTSESACDLNYPESGDNSIEEKHIPSGPLPRVPPEEDKISSEDSLVEEEDSDDEAEEENDDDDDGTGQNNQSGRSDSPQSGDSKNDLAVLRHRRRVDRKQQMEKKVRDIKRRQQANEHWQQLKRSLFVPFVVGGAILIGGGVAAYVYFKHN